MTNPSAPSAVGPAHAPVRVWRSWGDCAMPAPKLSHRRGERLAWLFTPAPVEPLPSGFREQARPAAKVPPLPKTAARVEDGRPALDCGHSDNTDRLLERLRAVHGEP